MEFLEGHLQRNHEVADVRCVVINLRTAQRLLITTVPHTCHFPVQIVTRSTATH